METTTRESLDTVAGQLLKQAQLASANAYAPHSKLLVGAAVRTSTGRTYLGCNVENASYGLTICAERSAIFAAVASEGRAPRITDVAIFAKANTPSPCGACRQVIHEFGPDARVIFPAGKKVCVAHLGELLAVPFRF